MPTFLTLRPLAGDEPRTIDRLAHARAEPRRWASTPARCGDGWVDERAKRVYAVLDNLSTHRAIDVLRWTLVHPRWEFVFQPTSAAYLNLIEPWWRNLRSLALKGRRCETWVQLETAIDEASAYWNHHRHPFVWGRRTRGQASRTTGIAQLPLAA